LDSYEHQHAHFLCLVRGVFKQQFYKDSDDSDATEATASKSHESQTGKEEETEGEG